MKICILSDASSYHTKRWVDYFVKRGWETHLVSLEKPVFKTEGIEHILPSHIPLRSLKYFLASNRVRRILKRIQPDILNAHFVPNYGLLGVLSKVRPLVVNCWGSDILISAKRSIFHRLRASCVLKRADLIIVDAEMLKQAVAELGIDEKKVLTIPIGVDTSVFKLKGFFKSQDIYRVIHYRPLEPLYNPLPLVRAIPLVEREFNDRVRFIIQRRGSLYENIRELSIKLGIEGFIYFIDELDHSVLSELLRRCDVYTSLSTSDSTSVSLLETMASGLFPVVSDTVGNREWIRDRENGFLVPLNNERYLASKIIEALKYKRLRVKAARINREIIEKRADWQKNMKKVEEIFYNLYRG